MKSVFDHIEHVQGQPHHIRRRVAFAAAGSATGLIALVWLAGSLSSGAFAIKGSSFAESAGQMPVDTVTASPNLAGAAAALPNAAAGTPARIEIVDAASSTRGQKKVEQTVIPF